RRSKREVDMNVRATCALTAGIGLVAASAAASSGGPKPPSWVVHGRYAPVIRAADFVSTIDNRYYPLRPGTVLLYRGVKDGKPQTDEMAVTNRVKTVLGVKATVVRDTVSQNGTPIERTDDWYAQDKRGNVWYMGEEAFDRKNGRFVRASDSWEAGVKGAKPG